MVSDQRYGGLWGWIKNARRGRFLSGLGWLWSGNGVELVLALAQAIVVARVLGPDRYGTAILIMAYPTAVLGLVHARTQDPAIRWLGTFVGRRDFRRTLSFAKLCFAVDFAIAIAAFVVVAATAPWAAPAIVGDRLDLSLLLAFAAALVAQAPATTSRAILTILDRFDLHARYTILVAVVRVALVTSFVLLGFGVSGVVWANILVLVATGCLYMVVAQHHAREAWGATIWTQPLSSLRGYGRRIGRYFAATEVDSIFETVAKQSDVLILGHVLGPTPVGYYRLASRIVGAVSAMISPLDTVSFPHLARVRGAGDAEGYRRLARRYLGLIALPGAFVVATLGVLLAPVAVRLIGGPEFTPATGAAQILMGTAAVAIATFWLVPVLLVEGYLRLLVARRVVTTVLLVPGYFLATSYLGINGMAWTSLLTALVVNGLLAGVVLMRVLGRSTVEEPMMPDASE